MKGRTHSVTLPMVEAAIAAWNRAGGRPGGGAARITGTSFHATFAEVIQAALDARDVIAPASADTGGAA